MDAKSPEQRLRYIVEDCQPAVIICSPETHVSVQSLVDGWISGKRPIVIVLGSEEIERQQVSLPPIGNIQDDLAYIFYTSGSTGKPKGVMITHGNLINFVEWAADCFQVAEDDIIANHAPLHFDISGFDIYASFKKGATLVLVPPELSLFPAKIVNLIEQEKITIWQSVPSILVHMAKMGALQENTMPSLKKIIFIGEVFPTPFLIRWMKTFPKKEFINFYGPTECTIGCAYYPIKEVPEDSTTAIPLGRAAKNMEMFALKEDDSLANVGEIGELCIRGPTVSPGYWNNKEKTEKAFVVDPLFPHLNGKIYKTGDLVEALPEEMFTFRGRKDSQIKFMGYRIELGEIESALYSLGYVKEAAVIYLSSDEKSEIVAFVALNRESSPGQIKDDLKKKIPSYMIPRTITIKDALPLNSSGKIDRVKLRQECENDGN